MKYPFLISIPHGGVEIPAEVAGRFALTGKEIHWYCDPSTRTLFDFGGSVEATIDTPVSRMVIDLNRPPLPLPPRDPDGIIKVRTVDGRQVYRPGQLPDLPLIHRLMMRWYFPYHQRIDDLIDRYPVRIAFDCHSMLPYGSAEQNDAGKCRPLICLGNYGDENGRAKPGSLTTCPSEWIVHLAESFREEFCGTGEVAINTPFSGGFISNAHYWRKGIPWIQIEVNRALYEPEITPTYRPAAIEEQIAELRHKIWQILTRFWAGIAVEALMEESSRS
ncbi:MAG: N-formylglutamate amidohydrolase [Methanoregula sp.]|jgi:formiminoglutamase|uniref:N-formylglutamate amidohydrolase n=1 Tax=Methanoregula sp. TaxID=2052170 RepID=UPI003C14FD66